MPFHDLPLPKKIEAYLESLTPKEKKGYLIAKSHLGSSFQIEKSLGFVDFVKKSSTDATS
jgi:hypothetical protein